MRLREGFDLIVAADARVVIDEESANKMMSTMVVRKLFLGIYILYILSYNTFFLSRTHHFTVNYLADDFSEIFLKRVNKKNE